MNIEVRLPDGSLASFPEGTSRATMEAEIERYLASVGQSEREQAGRETRQPYQPPTMGATELNRPEVRRAVAPEPNDTEMFRAPPGVTSGPDAPYQPPTMGATELNRPEVRRAVAPPREAARTSPSRPSEFSVAKAADEARAANGDPRMLERQARTMGMSPEEFAASVTGAPNPEDPRSMPMNEMERLYASGDVPGTERPPLDQGPPRRSPQRQPYQPPTMGATELNRPEVRRAIRDGSQPQPDLDYGPPRRSADVDIRSSRPSVPELNLPQRRAEMRDAMRDDAQKPEKPMSLSEMSDERLLAERMAVKSGGMGEFFTDAGEAVTGAVRSAGEAGQRALGKGLSTLGLTGAGSFFLEGASETRDLSNTRVNDEAKRDAARAEQIEKIDAELERRGIDPEAATQSSDPEAAAEPAGADVESDAQPSGTLPPGSERPTASRQPLRMPKGLSIQNARNAGQGPQSATFTMGDGTSVRVGKAPEQAMKNGVQSGMDFLISRADQVILKMLQAGDITGATQFRDFIANEQTQKGMRHMNQAVVAANYGDNAAFTSAISNMAKSYDPDGEWQVDTKGTRLITTDTGQSVGAVLSLRNKNTGEVFEQEYMGMQNVIAAVSDWGSPTAAYDRQKERVTAASNQRIANAKSYQEAFDAAFEAMFDSDSFVDYEKNAISQDELNRRIEMVKQRIQAVRPDLAPPSGRAPQGAASGVGAVTGGSQGQPVPTWGG